MIPRTYLAAIAGVVLVSVVFAAVMASRVPDPAPIHWNLRGEIDGHGPKWLAVVVFPALTALFAGIFVVLPRFGLTGGDPRWIVPYSRVALGVVALLAALGILFHAGAAGADVDLASVILVPSGLFIGFLGVSMRGVPRNPWMGIRTPWTLKSDAVWEATHRAGAAWMVAVGLFTAVSAFLLPTFCGLGVLFAGLIGLCVWSFVYSRRAHRRLGDAATEVDSK